MVLDYLERNTLMNGIKEKAHISLTWGTRTLHNKDLVVAVLKRMEKNRRAIQEKSWNEKMYLQ